MAPTHILPNPPIYTKFVLCKLLRRSPFDVLMFPLFEKHSSLWLHCGILILCSCQTILMSLILHPLNVIFSNMMVWRHSRWMLCRHCYIMCQTRMSIFDRVSRVLSDWAELRHFDALILKGVLAYLYDLLLLSLPNPMKSPLWLGNLDVKKFFSPQLPTCRNDGLEVPLCWRRFMRFLQLHEHTIVWPDFELVERSRL